MSFAIRVTVLAACVAAYLPLHAEPHVLKGHVPNAVSSSRPVELLPRNAILILAIGLPLPAPADLDALLAQIADPASPDYQQYLTPDQFTDRFGPTVDDYQALMDFAQANGLTVTSTHPNRTILDVSGSVADIEKAFHIKIGRASCRERV